MGWTSWPSSPRNSPASPPLGLEVELYTSTPGTVYIVLGNQTLVLIYIRQALYLLSHLPSPICSFSIVRSSHQVEYENILIILALGDKGKRTAMSSRPSQSYIVNSTTEWSETLSLKTENKQTKKLHTQKVIIRSRHS